MFVTWHASTEMLPPALGVPPDMLVAMVTTPKTSDELHNSGILLHAPYFTCLYRTCNFQPTIISRHFTLQPGHTLLLSKNYFSLQIFCGHIPVDTQKLPQIQNAVNCKLWSVRCTSLVNQPYHWSFSQPSGRPGPTELGCWWKCKESGMHSPVMARWELGDISQVTTGNKFTNKQC